MIGIVVYMLWVCLLSLLVHCPVGAKAKVIVVVLNCSRTSWVEILFIEKEAIFFFLSCGALSWSKFWTIERVKYELFCVMFALQDQVNTWEVGKCVTRRIVEFVVCRSLIQDIILSFPSWWRMEFFVHLIAICLCYNSTLMVADTFCSTYLLCSSWWRCIISYSKSRDLCIPVGPSCDLKPFCPWFFAACWLPADTLKYLQGW